MAQTLSVLKGPLMKFGQMASIQSGFLPGEFTAPLAALRQNATPEPFSVIQAQIETELNAPVESLFKEIEQMPFAAASVGQVHRARTLDGQVVAVKVQYPNMEEFVDADVSSLTMALKAMGIASGQKDALKRVATEFRNNLNNELDYTLEARHQQLLQQFHAMHHPFVIIPGIVPELCTKRVLTSVLHLGDSLEVAAGYAPKVRDLLGERLLTILYDQVFGAHMLHGDPNPANYAFTPEGNILLYDFGCIKLFAPEEIRAIRKLLRGFLLNDNDTLTEGLREIGALPADAPAPDDKFFNLVGQLMAKPLHPTEPFDMAKSNMHLEVLSRMPQLRQYRKQFIIPAQLILLQRVNVGSYGNLRKLKAKIFVRNIIQNAIDRPPAAATPPSPDSTDGMGRIQMDRDGYE